MEKICALCVREKNNENENENENQQDASDLEMFQNEVNNMKNNKFNYFRPVLFLLFNIRLILKK